MRTPSGRAWAARSLLTRSPNPAHLNARDVTLAFASRAPQAEIQTLKERHGWEHIPWYTITDDWDKDFGVDEWHGHNAFIREGDQIYRTYFIDGRGDEAMGTTWSYLDMAPLGRQEDWEDSPEDYPQTAPYGWWTTMTPTAHERGTPNREMLFDAKRDPGFRVIARRVLLS